MDWVDRLEKLVKPGLAIAFGLAFIAGFIITQKISAEVFTGTAGFVLGYYFRAKDADSAREASQQAQKQTSEQVVSQLKAINEVKGTGTGTATVP